MEKRKNNLGPALCCVGSTNIKFRICCAPKNKNLKGIKRKVNGAIIIIQVVFIKL